MSSNIGRVMLDTLLESEAHIQDIAQFFLIFVKLKDATTSKAFRVSGCGLVCVKGYSIIQLTLDIP